MNSPLIHEFTLIDSIALVVGLLGSVMYVVEASVLFRKPQKFYEEWVISLTVVTFLLYFIGNLLALFARAMVADIANLIYQAGWIVATVGMVFIPSFLLHAYGCCYFFYKVGTNRDALRRKVPNGVLMGGHLVGFYFLYRFLGDISATSPLPWPVLTSSFAPTQFRLFSVWLGGAAAVSGIFSLKLASNPVWERWRKYFPINGIFLFLAAATIWGVLWSHPWGGETAPLVRLTFLTISLFPGALLGYFLVRYQFMYIFVKPALMYGVLAGLIVLIYTLGIQNLSHYLGRFPTVNVGLVETVLLLALILLIQPVRARLQTRLNTIFFPESKKFRETVYDISRELKTTLDLERIRRVLGRSLEEILGLRNVSVVLRSLPEAEAFAETFRFLTISPEPILFRHMAPSAAGDEISAVDCELVIAVRDGKDVLGLLCLGPKLSREEITTDEIHFMRTVANQLAITVKNTELAQEQLKLQRLMMKQEKLSTLGQITSSITHEVKNPISSINTLVQVMQEELPEGGELKKDLETIENEIAHLNDVLSGILKYSRPESLELQPVLVHEVIRDVFVLLDKEARTSGVELEFPEPSQTEVTATLDGLKEVFFNLVFNAIQACKESGGRIVIRSHQMNGRLKVVVQDTGPGIPEDKLPRLFEPYYTTKKTGTGLGLAIVKEKVEGFRGTVSARNMETGGTEFTVDLPLFLEGGIHDR